MITFPWKNKPHSREDPTKNKPTTWNFFSKLKGKKCEDIRTNVTTNSIKSHINTETNINSNGSRERTERRSYDTYSDDNDTIGSSSTSTTGSTSTSPSLGIDILIPDDRLEVTKEDFVPVVRLGKGSFASVILVRSILAERLIAERRQQKVRKTSANNNNNNNNNKHITKKKDKWSFLRKLLPESNNDVSVSDTCSVGSISSESNCSLKSSSTTTSSKLSTYSTLCKGGYGPNGDLFAMKIIPKKKLVDIKRVRDVFTERDILYKSSHPFLIKLHHTFQTPKKLFFIVDYMVGGNLRELISDFRHRRVRMPYNMVRLYAAEVTLALIHLHENKVIYRDLKPENILLDEKGHCALADFGLSKDFGEPIYSSSSSNRNIGYDNNERMNINSLPPEENWNYRNPQQQYNNNNNNWSTHTDNNSRRLRTASFVGSPLYVAPEVLRRERYSFEVDYWGLGVLIYTLLFGAEPFRAASPREVFEQILSAEVRFPKSVHATGPAISIVCSLLEKDPSRRLKDPEILAHPFFHGMDMNEVLYRRVIPEDFTCPPLADGIIMENNNNNNVNDNNNNNQLVVGSSSSEQTPNTTDTLAELKKRKFSELHESVARHGEDNDIYNKGVDEFHDFTLNVMNDNSIGNVPTTTTTTTVLLLGSQSDCDTSDPGHSDIDRSLMSNPSSVK